MVTGKLVQKSDCLKAVPQMTHMDVDRGNKPPLNHQLKIYWNNTTKPYSKKTWTACSIARLPLLLLFIHVHSI